MSLSPKTIVCPKCNCEIPGDSIFCQACGTTLHSVTVSTQSGEKLRQTFSNIDKWELMGLCRVTDRSARQITEQQRQEELETRIQSAQDSAIQKRIAITEAENIRKNSVKIVLFIFLAMIATALITYWVIQWFRS